MAEQPFDADPTGDEGISPFDDDVSYGDEKTPLGPLMQKFKPGSRAERRLASLHMRMWKAQDPIFERLLAQWGVNAARRAGIANAKLIRKAGIDRDTHWTAWLPKNATPDMTPDVNHSATLCRRLTSQMYVDPPIADVAVADGDDEDEAAAEISERALHSLQDEHHLGEIKKQRRAFSKSLTYASCYIEYFIDQQGGGQEPVTVEARADAQHASLALVDPITREEGPQIGLDGQPIPLQERMVDERGFFVESEEEAAVRYVAKLDSQVLDGRYVRLLPHTADDISDAKGVMIASMPTWGEVKRMFPGIDKLEDSTISEIMKFRPSFADALVRPGQLDIGQKIDKKWNDERPVFVLKSYHLACPEYPDGAMLITVGGKYVGHQSEWVDKSGDRKRRLSLPVSQMKGLEEGRDGYPHVALMELIGPGNEVRSAQIAAWLDHLDRFGDRKTYVPSNSTVDPTQLNNPRLRHIAINPGGQPIHEDVPDFPNDGPALYEEMGRGMENAVGLRESSGPNSKGNVTSGRHEFALLSQVHAGLAEFRQNAEECFVRSSRITLELARAFLDDEQKARWSPAGGQYRTAAWLAADLVDEPIIRIKPGSMTMLSKPAKSQMAERYIGMGIVDEDLLADVISSGLSLQVGLQDNPHRMRIKSQLAEWSEGPPEDWQPQPQQSPGVDPMTGQPLPPPLDPELQRIFEPVPADELPPVAAMRLNEIGNEMAGPKYLASPPEWRAGLDMEWARMGQILQATAPMPGPGGPGGPGGGGEGSDVPAGGGAGGLPKGSKTTTDLQEDALQEGAPPDMVI